jgi:hypothetical protein
MTAATAEREYTTVDKADWGSGPWQDEPDKVQWVDEATGLDCLAVRHPTLGHWCGYVGVPPEHPWHGRDYGDGDDGTDRYDDSAPVMATDVHGGLTYAAGCQEDRPESEGVCHVPAPGRPENVWWFGFDCAHLGDVSPAMDARERERGDGLIDPTATYKTLDYVKRETARLAAQIEGATKR